MVELLYKSKDFESKFIECMDIYQSFYWATAWAGHGFEAYELLLREEYRSKIKVLATGVYDYKGTIKTSKEFIKNFKDVEGVLLIGKIMNSKGKNPLHSKEYLFYNDNDHWEAFIGSANFTKAGFTTNYEAVLHFDQDSGNIDEMMQFFTDTLPSLAKLHKSTVDRLLN